MKRLYAVLLVLLIGSGLYAEELSVFDIKFGMSPAEVQEKMEARGWHVTSVYHKEDHHLYFKKENGTYANNKIDWIDFEFYKDMLKSIKIDCGPDRFSTESINAIVEKFNLKERYSNDYEDEFGNEFRQNVDLYFESKKITDQYWTDIKKAKEQEKMQKQQAASNDL